MAKLYLSVVRRGLLHVDPVQAEDDELLLLLQLRLLPRAAAPLGVAVRAAPSFSLAAAPEFVLLFPAHTEKTETVITLSLSTGWGKLSVFQGRRWGGGRRGGRGVIGLPDCCRTNSLKHNAAAQIYFMRVAINKIYTRRGWYCTVYEYNSMTKSSFTIG